MRKPLIPLFLFIGISLCLEACISPTKEAETQPTGLLYRCMGEAGYEPGAMDSILAFFATHPPICKDGRDISLDEALSKTTAQADSMSVRMVVMDSNCNLIEETSFKTPDQNPPYPTVLFEGNSFFNWKMKDGRPYATGEYYVNLKVDRPGKGSDTSYTKMGIVANRCAPLSARP